MPDILIDLDDVLVSFRQGAAKVHGWDLADMEQRGLITNTWQMADWYGIDQDTFWAPINAMGHEFWLGLPVNPWADWLMQIVRDTGCEWYIVTSPSLHFDGGAASHSGKMQWARKFLGDDCHRCIITKHKHKVCDPGDILIDDSPHNLASVEAKGGHGILFPLLGNENAYLRHDPIPYVQSRLKGLLVPS